MISYWFFPPPKEKHKRSNWNFIWQKKLRMTAAEMAQNWQISHSSTSAKAHFYMIPFCKSTSHSKPLDWFVSHSKDWNTQVEITDISFRTLGICSPKPQCHQRQRLPTVQSDFNDVSWSHLEQSKTNLICQLSMTSVVSVAPETSQILPWFSFDSPATTTFKADESK